MNNIIKWYIVRVIGGQEFKIKRYMENEIKRLDLSDSIQKVIVPSERVVQISNGRKIHREKVFFPGYVIIYANLIGEIPHVIREIPGVIGFLTENKGGDPVSVREGEINRMLGKIDKSKDLERVSVPYKIGDPVKVVDGPFNGFDGVIKNIQEDKRKIEVIVKFFGRSTPLELGYMQIDRIIS